MKVVDVMVKDAAACYPQSTLEDAARIMWERDCGFVPVVESAASGVVVGAITDRDVCMAAYTRGASLGTLRVADAMARVVQTCKPSDSIASAASRLAEARVRRLPVVDESGQLVGVLSFADLAREAARQRSRSKPELKEAEVGSLIASVCQPRELAATASA